MSIETDQHRIQKSSELKIMRESSQGFKHLKFEIENRIKGLYDSWIGLTTDQLNKPNMISYQARARELRDILEWIDEEISAGETIQFNLSSTTRRRAEYESTGLAHIA